MEDCLLIAVELPDDSPGIVNLLLAELLVNCRGRSILSHKCHVLWHSLRHSLQFGYNKYDARTKTGVSFRKNGYRLTQDGCRAWNTEGEPGRRPGRWQRKRLRRGLKNGLKNGLRSGVWSMGKRTRWCIADINQMNAPGGFFSSAGKCSNKENNSDR